MGFNWTILKMSLKLTAWHYMESFTAQDDHIADAFVHKNYAHGCDIVVFESLQLAPFC